jgi:hypothetical protein
VYYAKTAEIPVLGAKRAVDNVHFLDQLRAQRLQRTEIALTVALRPLILLHIVDKNFEATIDAAVVEVESEAADFERLASPFVLSDVDTSVELLKNLIVTSEERAAEDFAIAKIN